MDETYDPLLRLFELKHSALFHPLGFPVRINTNSLPILDAAAESFSHFIPVSEDPPLEFDVYVAPETGSTPPQPPTFRARRHLMMLAADSKHFGVCDFEHGLAQLWLTGAVFGDLPGLRYHFLDSCALTLVEDRYLAPVHAACVAWKGRGMLLSGRSEAGKSTLAYACARRGFTYTSDDGSFLVRASNDRIATGNCSSIRLRPAAAELFPELAAFTPVERANGKMAIEVRCRDLGFQNTSTSAHIDFVIVLNRCQSGPARIDPCSPALAFEEISRSLHYGRDSAIAEARTTIWRLLEPGVLQLTYSNTNDAVDALMELA